MMTFSESKGVIFTGRIRTDFGGGLLSMRETPSNTIESPIFPKRL